MNSTNNSPHPVAAVFKIIGLLFKIFFTGPMAVVFLLATGFLAYEQLAQIWRFIQYRVFPAPYIVGKICLVLFTLGFSLLFLRLTFNKKLSKLSYKTILLTMIVSVITSAICELVDDMYTQNFDFYSYPPYILDWPTQSVNSEMEYDDTQDTVYLSGDFNVVSNGFRQPEYIQFVAVPDLTDKYRVEIIYRGNPAEIYIYRNDSYIKGNRCTDDINIWPIDYDYDTPPQDIAYMYKHGINLEYSEPLVVEKIIIYTAYPEKFDTTDMWFQS